MNQQEKKQAYQPPRLTEYGGVSHLTLGRTSIPAGGPPGPGGIGPGGGGGFQPPSP
ncbi:lasso RiPP family leader peptide-containing protein [Methylomarinovum caldicuralii]|uniref:lasso RiPP family leader peptide-containing protein n=1 Tax=Methylomarinovum caldicuralii TaxID=438856 RepID=UPI002953F4A2|nr:lasso RiPP family leader peptide-containing protein [Methylomarinovum caldicuralii]